jgi:type I restriction enzyme S subunit
MSLVFDTFGRYPKYEGRLWGEIKKGYTHFADGDVVLAKITPCFENGKAGVMRDLPNGFGAGTTELHVVRPIQDCVMPEYIWIFFKSAGFRNSGAAQMTGTAGQKRVPKTYVESSVFPLAPLAEQKRIVAKVDQLMALCDDLEAKLQQTQTDADNLLAAIVHELVNGNAERQGT